MWTAGPQDCPRVFLDPRKAQFCIRVFDRFGLASVVFILAYPSAPPAI
jgi:hypothetical protein